MPPLHTTSGLAVRRARARRRRLIRRVLGVALVLAGLAAATIALAAGHGRGEHRRARVARALVHRRAVHYAAVRRSTARRRRDSADSRSVARLVAGAGYVRIAGHRRREVALTFDDGPAPITPRFLRLLRRHHAPATFFLIGRAAYAHPRIVRAEARDGFVLGDHTEDHVFLAALPPADQRLEVSEAAKAITAAGGPPPELLRPPYGSVGPATLGVATALHMAIVLWSVDTKDFSEIPPVQIVRNVLGGVRSGEIVLMHDGGGDRTRTLAALPAIIHGIRARGFRLVTVPQLIHDDPPAPTTLPPPNLSGL